MEPSVLLTKLNKTISHRPIRDLAWCLLHPSLFGSQLHQHYPDIQLWPSEAKPNDLMNWLHTLDQEPELLLQHLQQQRATRLGIYFEQLLSFYFAHYPRFELVAKNLQVNNGKRTIGEYDFIVLDKAEKQRYHIEVAIKFYVGLTQLDIDIEGNTPIQNWHHWVGPNKKDSLAIKMQHLMQHQLPLSTTAAGKATLETININPEQLQQRLLVNGRLYLPLKIGDHQTQIEPPTYTAHKPETLPNWIDAKQIDCFIKPAHHYILLPRQQWMAELTYADINTLNVEITSGKQLQATLLQESQTPLHIAQLKADINPDTPGSIESARFFYLP